MVSKTIYCHKWNPESIAGERSSVIGIDIEVLGGVSAAMESDYKGPTL